MPTLKKILKLMKTPPVVGTLIGLGVFAVVLQSLFAGRFQFLELKIYDVLLNLQPKDTRAAKQVVVVGIDELDPKPA
jgi:CHASE2 domain-containing sensor protein